LRKIQREYLPRKYPQKKVLGVLIPAAEVAGKKTQNKKIGVLATVATVRSNSFKREILKVDPGIKLFQKACPLLAPIVERGEQDSLKTKIILKKYLSPLIKAKIDTLILGCTHYGLLEEKIRKIAGKDMKIISESKIIGKKLKNYLRRHPEIEKRLGKNKKRVFYSSAPGKNFEILGSQFFGEKIKVRKAVLD
jgi:glutamate racemase